MSTTTQKFDIGFNHGLVIGQHEPEVAQLIASTIQKGSYKSEYRTGFESGYNVVKDKEHDKSVAQPAKDMQTQEQRYTKGFNHGYVFAKYEPQLAQVVAKSASKSEYVKGFVSGKQEYDIQKIKERLQDKDKPKAAPTKNINKNKGRTK